MCIRDRQGRLDESIEELNLIVSAWPDDDKSRYYLATAYREKEDFENALDHFRHIELKSEYFVNAQIQIADILDARDGSEEAISILKEAVSKKKEDHRLFLILASFYERNKEYEKAIETLEQGLNTNDSNVNLLFQLGVLFDKTGDKDSCIKKMRRILEIESDHAEALNYIGYTYAEQGIRLDEAMDLIKKAARLKPESGYIMDSLGWVYFRKGLFDKAVTHLEKANELTPDDPTINEHLGEAYFAKKDYEKSLEYYKKALSLKHPDEESLKNKILEAERLLNKTE